jgi:energy-coupling factor transporter ATP-binding protein EcfA2
MGRINDFEQELGRQAKSRCATWHAIDLHNHTPASEDYEYHQADCAEKLAQQIRAQNLSAVMFTDHNRLPDSELVRRVTDSSGRLILRGVELNVFVDAWQKPQRKVDKALFFHLLIGFDPTCASPPEYWMEHIRRSCREEERHAGGRPLKGVASPIDDVYRILRDANALIIPAHLHSTHDAFKSRSIDDIYNDNEFLRHAREHFTALEVTKASTATYFDGKHNETGYLCKTCIQSSDSHHPGKLGWRPSYLQMEETTCEQLKAGLELPFRCSLRQPLTPATFIVGVHVEGQFLKDLWVSFSTHCNALIGVKGSGKTSLLESLRFVLGSDVPKSKLQAVNEHLDAILGPGGKVTALVKRADGARVLIERSNADKSFLMTFEDDRQERFSHPEPLHFPAYILGWHEIEQAATDVNIRRLYMDTISGKEQVRTLTEKAEGAAASIRTDHERASAAYSLFRQLESQVDRLKELRKGLQDLTEANLIELRDKYQAATEHREALRAAYTRFQHARQAVRPHLKNLLSGFDRRTLEGASPVSEAVGNALQVVDEVLSAIDSGAITLEEKLGTSASALEQQVAFADQAFRSFAEDYTQRLASLSREQRELLESHRKVMEETATLPTLERERESAKQEVERLLRELIAYCDTVADCLDKRTQLRRGKISAFSDQIRSFDVRMSVVGLQAPQQYQDYTQRYSQGARLWTDLRSSMSDRLGHLSLKRAYLNLLENLHSGYSLFFEHPEFGHFLSVFEDDDLQIDLRVGKGEQDYRPISNISAGQRCTAIFPILLKQQAGPLVVDQPEDNLDNRHIASSISPVLLDDKRSRQIMFTSHNANLVVLSDPELIITFESDGASGRIEEHGFLGTYKSPITKHVLDILDGGERALDLRQRKYSAAPKT